MPSVPTTGEEWRKDDQCIGYGLLNYAILVHSAIKTSLGNIRFLLY